MSKVYALVRFKDGSVFRTVYDGAEDQLSPWIISDKDLKRKFKGDISKFDSFKKWESCRDTNKNRVYDAEDVQIYVNYGHGFVMKGEASQSGLCITSELHYYENNVTHELPIWVYEWFLNHGNEKCPDHIENSFKKPQFHVGDFIYSVVTVEEMLYCPGMFKPSSPSSPIKKKIVHISLTDDDILYQVKGTCHFTDQQVGILIFGTYEEAEKALEERYKNGSSWNRYPLLKKKGI